MRADRLLSILMLLQTRGRMTARDLAEQLEVSERTIYRDLDALSIAGIPVYPERGPGGGYSLVDGYQTRLTGLTGLEIRALFLSTITGPLVDLGMARALEDALLKLSASLSEEARSSIEQARQRFHIDPSWTPHDGQSASILSIVQDAIWHNQRVYLVSSQSNGQQQRYLLEPYGLVAREGEWYLVAAHAGRHATYALAHTLCVEATEQRFERSDDFDLTTYWTEYQRTRSKKTYFVSQKTQNGRSPFKKKSILRSSIAQISRNGTTRRAYKKNDIKKMTPPHTSYFASFPTHRYAA